MNAHAETFIAGWNMPGCLPDTAEPLPEFDNTVEAWEYIVDEIERAADDETQMVAEGRQSFYHVFNTDEIDQTRPGSFQIGNMVYFVQRVEPGQ